MILPLFPADHPVLHTPTQEFDFANPQTDPIKLAEDLIESCVYHKGLGLSANQVGISLSVFAFGNPAAGKLSVLFNPKIVGNAGEVDSKEGCLSYPNVFLKVKRSERIRVRYADASGNVDTVDFTGLSAKIVQHEIDHLNGITYGQRISKMKLRMALKNTNFVVGNFYPKA